MRFDSITSAVFCSAIALFTFAANGEPNTMLNQDSRPLKSLSVNQTKSISLIDKSIWSNNFFVSHSGDKIQFSFIGTLKNADKNLAIQTIDEDGQEIRSVALSKYIGNGNIAYNEEEHFVVIYTRSDLYILNKDNSSLLTIPVLSDDSEMGLSIRYVFKMQDSNTLFVQATKVHNNGFILGDGSTQPQVILKFDINAGLKISEIPIKDSLTPKRAMMDLNPPFKAVVETEEGIILIQASDYVVDGSKSTNLIATNLTQGSIPVARTFRAGADQVAGRLQLLNGKSCVVINHFDSKNKGTSISYLDPNTLDVVFAKSLFDRQQKGKDAWHDESRNVRMDARNLISTNKSILTIGEGFRSQVGRKYSVSVDLSTGDTREIDYPADYVFSSNGKRIAFGIDDRGLSVVDVKSGKLVNACEKSCTDLDLSGSSNSDYFNIGGKGFILNRSYSGDQLTLKRLY